MSHDPKTYAVMFKGVPTRRDKVPKDWDKPVEKSEVRGSYSNPKYEGKKIPHCMGPDSDEEDEYNAHRETLKIATGDERMTSGKHKGSSFNVLVKDQADYCQFMLNLPSTKNEQTMRLKTFLKLRGWKVKPMGSPGYDS